MIQLPPRRGYVAFMASHPGTGERRSGCNIPASEWRAQSDRMYREGFDIVAIKHPELVREGNPTARRELEARLQRALQA